MIRLTFFFSTDNFTWTESHYHTSAGTIAAAMGDMSTLYDARLQVLCKPAAIIGVRLSDTTKPRLSQPIVPDGGKDVGLFDPGGDPEDKYADRPYSSVIIEYVGKNGYTSRGYMSGIADVIVTEDPGEVNGLDPTFAPIFKPKLALYLVALTAAWGWRRLDPAATVPIVGLDLTTLPSGEIGIITAAPLVFSPSGGTNVNITGFRSVNPRRKGIRGTYAVDVGVVGYPPVAAPFRYFLRGTSAAQAANVTPQLGKVCPLTYAIEQYASGELVRATHRKRGARALAPLGRSRGRPC